MIKDDKSSAHKDSHCVGSEASELYLKQPESSLVTRKARWRRAGLETSITSWSLNVIRKKNQDVCKTSAVSIGALLNHVS